MLNPYFKVKDPTQRYKQLLFYAQKLKGFPEVFKSYLRKSFLEGLFFLKEQKIDQNKVNVNGGGNTGQVEAIRLAISRALCELDAENRPALKSDGLLTRDSRVVERKKPGQKKARKKFQWVKR